MLNYSNFLWYKFVLSWSPLNESKIKTLPGRNYHWQLFIWAWSELWILS